MSTGGPRLCWRGLRIACGVVLAVVGAATTPTPVPVGLAVVTAGLGILLIESRPIRGLVCRLRRRCPRLSRRIRRATRHLPAAMRRALARTDPFRDEAG